MVKNVFLVYALWVATIPSAPGENSPWSVSPVIWLEAEGFEETGEWPNDPQFVGVMGRPILLRRGPNGGRRCGLHPPLEAPARDDKADTPQICEVRIYNEPPRAGA